jgi:prepilin peptidase CpaA
MFQPSPTGLFWGALFALLLLVAAVVDIRERRIPNVLVAVLLLSGFAFSLTQRPLGEGLLASLLGGALGFALFIPFWPLGLIGAGDVKLFAAAGVWLGPSATWGAALAAALAGGVLAIFTLVRSRQLGGALRRIGLAVASRSAAILTPPPEQVTERPGGHVPYGVAIAIGALFAAWRPSALG